MATTPTRKSPKTSGTRKSARKSKKPTFTEQARRKQILEVSKKMFSSRGYDATSLDEIASEVGVSRGVIFYYFDGKREIGEQTVRQCIREYGAYVQDRVSRIIDSKEQLLEFVDACLDYLDAHRQDYLLYVDLIGCFGGAAEKYDISVSANRRTREWLVGVIKKGQKSGELKKVPAKNLADVIQGVVDGLMELSALEPNTVDISGCKILIRKMILGTIEV